MKAFVTGGTGFIGQRVVDKLIERGYEVAALARSENGASRLRAAGAIPVQGDIQDLESMRAGMVGSDVVFHIAGWYKLGSRDWRQAEQVNVQGTRNVLGLAYELGIPKIIYTSTVAVFGNTQGRLCDETYQPPESPFLTEYDRTKWKAHYEVALPLIQEGAPVIILMPGGVYGPGDPSLVGDFMKAFYKGLFPVLPGPELVLTFAHVDDVAEGHILAAEKGVPGETYILAGPAASIGEMVKLWAEVTGKPAPYFYIPARFVKPLAPVMGILGSILPLPQLISRDALTILDACYRAEADKARQQLDWRTRPLEEGMRETFEWIARAADKGSPTFSRRQQAAALTLAAAFGLTVLWLLNRNRQS